MDHTPHRLYGPPGEVSSFMMIESYQDRSGPTIMMDGSTARIAKTNSLKSGAIITCGGGGGGFVWLVSSLDYFDCVRRQARRLPK